MDLLAGAWAPHVIWYLSAQPRRFGELRIDIPRISARVLSRRLRELEARGVVTRTDVPTTPPSTEYRLTDLGREVVPAVAAIAEVGRSSGARLWRIPGSGADRHRRARRDGSPRDRPLRASRTRKAVLARKRCPRPLPCHKPFGS
jgi:DNA-binding HxlR family transcriptional regulator